MKIASALRLPALAAGFVLLGTALRAADPYELETKLFVYRDADFREVIVGDGAASSGGSQVFQAPQGIRLDGNSLSLVGGEALWNGSEGSPRKVDLVGNPVLPLSPGQAASILSSASEQYLERQADGSLKVVKMPADSPDAPHCRLTFVLHDTSPDGTRPLTCDLDLTTVQQRADVPGVELPVGKPVTASSHQSFSLTPKLGEWSAISLRSPNGSHYSMLVLVKVSARDEHLMVSRVGHYKLHVARFAAASVTDGRYIYTTGGIGWNGMLGDIERFDPVTHESVVITEALTPRLHHGAALIDGKLYSFGGVTSGAALFQDFDSRLEIYDMATGKVSQGAGMPTRRGYFTTVVVKGRIFAIGGTKARGTRMIETGEVSIYDPATNSWASGSPMPSARAVRAAVLVNDTIVVAGGYRRPKIAVGLMSVNAYFPAKAEWTDLPELSVPVAAHSGATLGHHLLLFGNFDPADQLLDYDLRTHVTTEVKGQMIAAAQTTAITLGGSVFVIGGVGGGGRDWNDHGDAQDDIQEFRLVPEKN